MLRTSPRPARPSRKVLICHRSFNTKHLEVAVLPPRGVAQKSVCCESERQLNDRVQLRTVGSGFFGGGGLNHSATSFIAVSL